MRCRRADFDQFEAISGLPCRGSRDSWCGGFGGTRLIIDDTALPKRGKAPVGAASQHATALGKNANCQALV